VKCQVNVTVPKGRFVYAYPLHMTCQQGAGNAIIAMMVGVGLMIAIYFSSTPAMVHLFHGIFFS
jgi:hypothetical protein